MFRRIFAFELYYRLRRHATYVYFLLVFCLSFFAITSPTAKVAGAIGNVSPNSPYVISVIFILLPFLMTMISSAVMGFAMVRDREHNLESILFTTQAQKFDYLFGRFAGSFTILLLMGAGGWLGLLAGYEFGLQLPWDVSWKHSEILKSNLWHYLQPFLYFTVTNLFISGSLFFISGALVRNTIILYTQGLILLLSYQLSVGFLQTLETKEIASLIDPFGIVAFTQTTQYWTAAEKNMTLFPFEGAMMYNRLMWMGISLAGLTIGYFAFSFKVSLHSTSRWLRWRRRRRQEGPAPASPSKPPPKMTPDIGAPVLATAFRSALLYVSMIVREIPFLAIVICGLIVFVANATTMNDMYGSSSYPTTFVVLRLIESFGFFFFIIAVFYSGELIWMDHRHHFQQITGTLPISGTIHLASKFLALAMIYIALILLLFAASVGVQTAYGYYNFQPGVYLGTLFGSTYTSILLFTFLCFFVQVLVKNKFLGFAICIVFILVEAAAMNSGYEADFLLFGGGSLGIFSDMNGYGHHVTPFVWLRLYWLAFALILFLISAAVWSHGGMPLNVWNWNKLWSNSGRPVLKPLLAWLSVFLALFTVLYYNSRILNTYESKNQQNNRKAEYERIFKKYDSVAQLRIVEVGLTMDLEPGVRDFSVSAHYYLKNTSGKAIPEVHLQLNRDPNLSLDTICFDRTVAGITIAPDFHYHRYAFDPPLSPGDSLRMDFKLTYSTKGFELKASNDQIAYNGTFINHSYFPALGYNPSMEIEDEQERFEYGLGNRHKDLSETARGTTVNQYGDDADRIRFEALISTEGDQIAIAPGRLKRTWKENNRSYFQYKAAEPITNFYSILSGRYSVHHVEWNGVKLEIYHHPDHDFNVGRMAEGMQDALAFCSAQFGKYPHDEIRIVEFPRYSNFAQSFAQTIPYSEGIGFIFKVRDPRRDLDMAYYTTVHEVAHQWWGQLIIPSNQPGGALLTEGLAQYSALAVVKKKFPAEVLERYLLYELKAYLTGRYAEHVKEEPLVEVQNKNYLQYSKASLAFFALQDYVGEDQVNKALARFAAQWSMSQQRYPCAADLVTEIRKVTPDTLQYLVTDLFESITLYDNIAHQCYFEKSSSDHYEIFLKIGARKVLADSVGRETEMPLNDWIDIGIYGEDREGNDKLIYLRKHKITAKEQVINLSVRGRPVRASIDPLHKLIDRHPDDNKVVAQEVVDLANVALF
jgi:ABC-2 type transport system permease protein